MPKTNDKAPPAKQPTTVWGHIVQITPIVLTVLATALAGWSSSEMTQSMYCRTLAGQYQAKAGDQWAFFQAKRIRSASLDGTIALLRSLGHVEPLDGERLKASLASTLRLLTHLSASTADSATAVQAKFEKWLAAAQSSRSLVYLTGTDLPKIEEQKLPATADSQKLTAAVQAISRPHSEDELATLVKAVSHPQLDAATLLAEKNADAFGVACQPEWDALTGLHTIVADLTAAAKSPASAAPSTAAETPTVSLAGFSSPAQLASADAAGDRSTLMASLQTNLDQLSASVEATGMDFDARRLKRESVYTQNVAQLYEIRVARCSIEADVHRERSRRLFYSMLLAQAGVTIASLALARAHHSVFWSLAALAAVCSLTFTAMTFFSLV